MMKKLYILAIVFTLSLGDLMAQNSLEPLPKLSPLTRKYLKELETQTLPEGYIYKTHADGALFVPALIKVGNAEVAEPVLQNIGALLGTKAGDIWTVRVPVERVKEFVKIRGIAYIQIDEPVFPTLDIARKTTRTDSVHAGYNLPMQYSGKNVVIGIIDFGFDYSHPTFYDTTGTQYRIKKVWELDTNGTPPAGFTYGNEITSQAGLLARGTDNKVQTHGAAVAGLAGGSGYGGPAKGKFRGMAYGADLVFVGVRRDSIEKQWMQSGFSDFIDGVDYIFKHADAVSKPAVVNISWGSQSGPHDGSSLFNQACDNLSGKGKIIVMSAGNDGTEKIHLAKAFTATDSLLTTFLTFNPTTYKRTWVDAWGEAGKDICATVTLYHNGVAHTATPSICLDDNIHNHFIIGSNGTDTCFVEFITSQAEFNGKPRLMTNVFNKSQDSVSVTLSSKDGVVHVWNEYYYYGYKYRFSSEFDSLRKTFASTGNTVYTVSDMGSAQSVLLVGAYTSKNSFTNLGNQFLSYSSYSSNNQLTPFSSRGPMVDGRIKPDITAPGLTIASSVNSYNADYVPTGASKDGLVASFLHPVSGKTYYYGEFTGTSASAPIASGIVALLLEANPSLSPQQLKTILFETAITDIYTGPLPAAGNNNWGHGKINAYGAMKRALVLAGVDNLYNGRIVYTLYPNPNAGTFSLGYTAEETENLEIKVYNTVGSLVATDTWAVEGGSHERAFDFSYLPKGIYMLQITGKHHSGGLKMLVE